MNFLDNLRYSKTFPYPKLFHSYSIIRLQMELIKSGLNSEQASLRRPNAIYIEIIKEVVLIARVVLISSGRLSGTIL